MTYRLPRIQRLGRVMHAFLMFYTIGIWCWLFITMPYRSSGKLIVHGIERYRHALDRGRVVIVANHPVVIESYFLSVLLVDSFWIRIPERWPYSFPDPASFLPRWLWWFYPLVRCVQVRRGSKKDTKNALLRARRLLNEGEVVVLHPEGGRTPKGEAFVRGKEGRRLRVPLAEGVATLARMREVQVLPVWIEPHGGAPLMPLSYPEAWHNGITITVGTPFTVPPTMNRKEAMHLLATRILEATT